METIDYDLVVLGAGSGGYAAARTARDLGSKVALVDHGPLGGLCILRGCMPSKAFIASSDALQAVHDADALGVRIDGKVSYDMPFIQQRKRALVKISPTIASRASGTFPLYQGHRALSSRTVLRWKSATTRVLDAAKSFIIATGSVVTPSLQIHRLREDAGYRRQRQRCSSWKRIPESVVGTRRRLHRLRTRPVPRTHGRAYDDA